MAAVLSALYTCEDCPFVCDCSHSLQGLSLYATVRLHLLASPAPLHKVSCFFLWGVRQLGPSAALSQNATPAHRLSKLGSCVPLGNLCHSSCFQYLTSTPHSAAAWLSCCIHLSHGSRGGALYRKQKCIAVRLLWVEMYCCETGVCCLPSFCFCRQVGDGNKAA